MLAVVIGGLDMARRRLTRETAEMERHIVNAMEGANRAASLTQRLLAFARQQPLQPEGVAVGPMILGMSEMLSRTLGEQIGRATSELQSLMRISYAVFCLKKKNTKINKYTTKNDSK